jgi:hypothetical protein
MRRFAALWMVCSILYCKASAQPGDVNFTSSNLPIVIINTNGQDIADDPKIIADMGIIYNGPGQRNNVTDPFNNYNGKIGVEFRGHSSQMFPMKSLGLELRNDLNVSVDQSILGMPKESDWVMYAPFTDKTLMRNFLAYTISSELGHWSARCRYVELVVNGNYRGVYVFMEKIKRNSNRVAITKMAKTDISGDAVTGGYIFSLDKDPNGWFSSFSPPNGNGINFPQFSFVVPKIEDVVPEQKEYLESYVDSFEAALAGNNFQDPVNGVRKFADLSSFMDYFIINELSHNVDGYRLSSYFYKDRNSKNSRIIAGPVWDYDLAFRNADYCNGSNTDTWAFNFNYVCANDGAGLVPFWWEKLMKDTAYTATLRCKWKDLRKTVLSETHIFQLIDSIQNLVQEAQARHFEKWPILGQYVWPNPNPIPTSYAGEITALKDWITARLKWMDENLPNNGICSDWPSSAQGTMIVKAYPNPLNDQATIIIQSKTDQIIYLQLVDMLGRVTVHQKISARTGYNTVKLDRKGLPRGIYVMRFINGTGEKITSKIMID